MLNHEGDTDMDFDPKKKIIQELMDYLRSKDDEDLGGAMKPKGMDVEIAKVEGGKPDMGSDAPQAKGISDGDGDEGSDPDSGMSEEDLNDLIEALSGKTGGMGVG